jgi:hypothetical protein
MRWSSFGPFWAIMRLFRVISGLFLGCFGLSWSCFVPFQSHQSFAWCCCMVVFGCHGFIKVNSWHSGLICISLGHAQVVLRLFQAVSGLFWSVLKWFCFVANKIKVVLGHLWDVSGCYRALTSCFYPFLGRFEVVSFHFKAIKASLDAAVW